MDRKLIQSAPWPVDLEDLVAKCSYRAHEGWKVRLVSDLSRDQATDENGVVTGEVIGHGATLVITTCGHDSYHPECGPNYRVQHFFIVPAATYNRDAWCRWLFDQFAKVELHECMEHFTLQDDTRIEVDDPCRICSHPATAHDGRDSSCEQCRGSHRFVNSIVRVTRPFAPTHGPGCDPYVVHERATDKQLRTRFTGEAVGE